MSPRDRTRPVMIALVLITVVGGSVQVEAFVDRQIDQHRVAPRSALLRRLCVEASCKQAHVGESAQAVVPARTGSLAETAGR